MNNVFNFSFSDEKKKGKGGTQLNNMDIQNQNYSINGAQYKDKSL